MSRTELNLNDELYEQAKLYTGLKSKEDVVNYALKYLVEQMDMETLLGLQGKSSWEGDLNQMRMGRDGSC
ncbi:MAG: type II toxin-antitoxin system VapB family antitoxin [Desulfuromonadales bacterium]|nr:type II toxin-antitoxin system VapB family antitoxin [Desulfuromonadales bacterium]